MRWLLALVAAALLLPGIAAAQGTPYGTVVVLKDRRAGFLDDVRSRSQQVVIVRSGQEVPATPDMPVFAGDAVRTAEGTCVVQTPEGHRVEVGERSQVKLGPTILQRLGDVFYQVQGAFRVDVAEVQLLVEGTGFRVTSGIQGGGTLGVVEGTVRARGAGDEVAAAPSTLTFTRDAPGPARALTPEEIAAIAAWRAERFVEQPVASGTRRNRLQLRLGGGLGRLDEFTWGQFGLAARIRLAGPLWVHLGADLLIRTTDELAGFETAFALPVHTGLRILGDLPRGAFLGGGADLELLVGAQCVDAPTCRRETTVEPGVLGSLVGGVLVGRHVGFDAEFAGGIVRRQFVADGEDGEALVVPDPRVQFTLGIFGRF